jgi:hypothetical protein
MAVIAIINIIITRRMIEGFELQIFIRYPFIGISCETGISGKQIIRYFPFTLYILAQPRRQASPLSK